LRIYRSIPIEIVRLLQYDGAMDTAFFLKGIVMGFSIAAPVGPIGILCIRRTLTEGRISGLATGLGAATADAMYGTVAALGLTFISGLLLSQRDWLSFVGGGFLIYLGFTTIRANAPTTTVTDADRGIVGSYLSALFLTLTNPMTILFFTAVFAGLGIADAAGDYVSGGLLVLGVFIGSALWWLLLTGGVVLLQTRVENISLVWINRIAGVVLIVFGVAALYNVVGSL